MEIKLKDGIDKLVFGMKREHVESAYGKPDRQFQDEDGNPIWVFNEPRLRLTFYVDEDSRLGYISSSHPDLTLHGIKLVGGAVDATKVALMPKGIKTWEKDSYDITEQYFNEANWIWLQAEFGTVVKVEFGVGMKEREDAFDWKFNS